MESFKTIFGQYILTSEGVKKDEGINEEEMKVPLSKAEENTVFTRLKGCRFFIYKMSPFLGIILRKLTTVLTYDMPTMAVDKEFNIYVNPRFALKHLSYDECIGVLAHEASHHATLTFERQKGRDHQLWNIATDFIMNRDLLRSGFALPKAGCLPRLENDGEKAFVDLKDMFGKLINIIDVSDISAEKLYKELLKEAKKNGMKSKGKYIVSKEKGSGSGEGGEIEAPEPVDGVVETPDKVKPIEGSPAPGKKSADDMRREVNVSDQASKREQDELDKMVEKEQEKKNRGGGPGGLRGHILKHHKAQANWRAILRRIVAKTVSEYDMRRPAKRPLAAGVYLPKQIYKDELPLIAIVLDTSGSMGPKEINAFLAEIKSLYNFYPKAQIMVLLCHTNVYYQILLTRGNLNQKLPEIAANCHEGGGIYIDPIYQYIKKEHLETRLAAVVILTDGWYCDGHIPTIQTFGNKIKSYALINDPTGMEDMRKIPGIELFYTQFT